MESRPKIDTKALKDDLLEKVKPIAPGKSHVFELFLDYDPNQPVTISAKRDEQGALSIEPTYEFIDVSRLQEVTTALDAVISEISSNPKSTIYQAVAPGQPGKSSHIGLFGAIHHRQAPEPEAKPTSTPRPGLSSDDET